jgi:tRNA A-37 threonylcarbamoyl transferase component Bud32
MALLMDSSAEKVEPDATFEPGTRVGGYRLEAFVAAGGMAEVYRARHLKLDKVVAIKFLDREHAKRPPVVARFLREGRFASQIRHPNVVEVTDVDEHEGLPYLVMEYLEGQTLSEVVRADGQLETAAIAEIMLPVCAAVAAAHANGVIHRDLKPGNVFLAHTDVGEVEPKVLDFGISKSLEEDPSSALTTSASFLGTPIYLSPEQAAGEDGTTASDQYSLGVILYELATGRRPYDTNQKFIRLLHSISKGEFEPPRVHREELSADLERIITRAMMREPDDRFPSVLALANELLEVADERTQTLWQPRLARQGAEKKAAKSEVGPVSGDAATELDAGTTITRAGKKVEAASGFDAARAEETGDEEAEDAVTELVAATSVSGGKRKSGERGAKRSRRGAIYLGVAAVVAALIWQAVPGGQPSRPPAEASAAAATPSSYEVAVQTEPPSAELVLDGTTRGTGRMKVGLPLDGRAHHLVVKAEGYVSKRFSFRDAPPPARVELERSPQVPTAPPSTTATASASTGPSAEPPPPRRAAPKAAPKPQPAPTYSAHPDNIDPWRE